MFPPVCAVSGMYIFAVARIDNHGFLVIFPAQVLSTSVAIGHKFALHGNVASWTDIISKTVRVNHHLRNRHLQAVTGKEHQKVPK